MELSGILAQIKQTDSEEVLAAIISGINSRYEQLRPELESIHIWLPKYDKEGRKRQLEITCEMLLRQTFE